MTTTNTVKNEQAINTENANKRSRSQKTESQAAQVLSEVNQIENKVKTPEVYFKEIEALNAESHDNKLFFKNPGNIDFLKLCLFEKELESLEKACNTEQALFEATSPEPFSTSKECRDFMSKIGYANQRIAELKTACIALKRENRQQVQLYLAAVGNGKFEIQDKDVKKQLDYLASKLIQDCYTLNNELHDNGQTNLSKKLYQDGKAELQACLNILTGKTSDKGKYLNVIRATEEDIRLLASNVSHVKNSKDNVLDVKLLNTTKGKSAFLSIIVKLAGQKLANRTVEKQVLSDDVSKTLSGNTDSGNGNVKGSINMPKEMLGNTNTVLAGDAAIAETQPEKEEKIA